ncbi:GNAT family N-acetyltransferase [Paenibacillus terrigena]|uniref:GNAT family N-acetyltransferase n=1 Tax=Paenibacillus terrigena TaxID=369333 RepID=UPI0003719F59|nr:GNAT family N-acetyltransferase [Paenibacillus terrigena]
MMIRKAMTEDCHNLSNLAYRSKAHWGYSEDFLAKCRDDLTVTEAYLEQHLVHVMERDNELIAFYSFSVQDKKLDALFIDPEHIGKGYGKQMWSDLLSKVKALHIAEFTLDSDPYAEAFYAIMGAKRIGEVASTVFPDRKLPLMHVYVK